jgi:hypothetical protein
MTTTEIEVRPQPPTDPAPTVLRLRNPWTLHLVAACLVASATLAGGFVAAAVLDAARLYLSAGAIGVALALVVGLSAAHSRFEACPPRSAWVER